MAPRASALLPASICAPLLFPGPCTTTRQAFVLHEYETLAEAALEELKHQLSLGLLPGLQDWLLEVSPALCLLRCGALCCVPPVLLRAGGWHAKLCCAVLVAGGAPGHPCALSPLTGAFACAPCPPVFAV